MNPPIHLVQLIHPGKGRVVALVKEPHLIVLHHFRSIYDLALESLETAKDIRSLIDSSVSDISLDYDAIYTGTSEWKLLPSFDCPENPFACLVSGTGLTHKKKCNEQAAHA